LLALALVVSFLSFIGIPPLAGFAGKLALFGAAIDAGYAWLAVLAAINTVVGRLLCARARPRVFRCLRRTASVARQVGCGGNGNERGGARRIRHYGGAADARVRGRATAT
jgi:formate hydrogenlyase subunit 3/multisubunit Na+/H+ antiporter MnhD subunit